MDFEKQQAAYDKGWAAALARGKEEHGNLPADLSFLETTGLIQPGMNVLEIGCGVGTLTSLLSKKGCRVIGTDISQEVIKYGREKYPGLDLRVESAEKLSFADAAFDLVLSFDVIEHLHEVDEHIDEVKRVLKPGGYYLLSTPNKWVDAAFETLKYRGLSWKWAHPSLQTWRRLKRRFERQGFACRFYKINTVTEFTLGKLRPYPPLHWLAKQINFTRLPMGLQTNFYLAARKS